MAKKKTTKKKTPAKRKDSVKSFRVPIYFNSEKVGFTVVSRQISRRLKDGRLIIIENIAQVEESVSASTHHVNTTNVSTESSTPSQALNSGAI